MEHHEIDARILAGDAFQDRKWADTSVVMWSTLAVEIAHQPDDLPLMREVSCPTLVIVGKQDPATPPAVGEAIAKAIKGAKLVALDAAHISNVEQPKAFTDAALNFLLN